MKKTFILHAKDSPIIILRVITDENYIVYVEDLTGSNENFDKFEKIEEFSERYFQIEPWYWFRGYEVK